MKKKDKEKLITMFMENDMTCLCGWKGTIIYFFLVYWSSKEGKAKFSVKLISKKTNMGINSAIRGIKDLLQYNLISVNSGKGKILEKNEYILLESSHWKTASDSAVSTNQSTPLVHPVWVNG